MFIRMLSHAIKVKENGHSKNAFSWRWTLFLLIIIRCKTSMRNISLIINADCKVVLLTPTCEGSIHDKRIADTIGYCVPSGSVLYQDSGFQGFSLSGINIVQPKKKPKGQELTVEEKERNHEISSIRVRIEHAISGFKRYRIIKDKLRNWKKGFSDLVMETCCGLHNFRLNFRPWCYQTPSIKSL